MTSLSSLLPKESVLTILSKPRSDAECQRQRVVSHREDGGQSVNR